MVNFAPMSAKRDDVPPTTGLLREMLVDVDEKHEDGHKRLREDIREAEKWIGKLEERMMRAEKDLIVAHDSIRELTREREKPIDGMKLRFPIAIVASVVVTVILATWALAEKMDGVNTSLSAQIKSTQDAQTAYMKRTDDKLQEQQTAIQQLRNRFELLQNNVTDWMLREQTRHR